MRKRKDLRHLGRSTLVITAAFIGLISGCNGRDRASTVSGDGSQASPQMTQWRDSSPHTVRFVTVPGNVRLEVLDWGGHGPPLVFLAGLGNTGHVFDDFAPRFTDRFHVLAITRRGWGASDHPPPGQYAMPMLVEDVHAVLDSLHLGAVNLVGHSIAGPELTWVAGTYPRAVRRVVYLDAAVNWYHLTVPSWPVQPAPSSADSASELAGFHFFQRMNGAPLPESEYRATENISPSGRDLGPKTPDSISAEVVRSVQTSNAPVHRVRAPVLVVFNKPASITEVIPWVSATDSAAPRLFEQVHALMQSIRGGFARDLPHARVVDVSSASHYVFVVQPDAVSAAMRVFLLAPEAVSDRDTDNDR